MVAWRRGEIELADSLFAVTVPRLHPDLGAWFAAPHALARDAPPPASGQDSVSWAPLDPDPTTPQNESRLEYWSRTTQAWLLMNDPLRPGLDSRAELMRRYGRPAAVVNAPLDSPQHRMYNALRASMYPDWRGPARGPGVPEFGYPYNAQAWEYPDLGARFVLEDRALNGHYEMPFVRLDEPVPGPNPNMIAARGDLMMLGDGEIILPALPPREQRLPVVVAFRRFESDSGPRLFGQIETAGGPADTLWMRWVVNDRHGVAVARGEDRAGLSSCDPVARRVATFSAAVPPGEYEVAVSLRDSRHRRGWIRGTEQLDPPGAGLALSDLVVTCSEASNAVSGGTVRLEVDPDPATAGTPLTAYFEVYRLARGSNHRSRFEYGFAVVPDGGRWSPDAATPPVNSVTREEEFEGGVRRQFLSVPVSWLPRGAYRLRVTVRDLVNGATATSEAPFVRL
jgi:hypothetical protein